MFGHPALWLSTMAPIALTSLKEWKFLACPFFMPTRKSNDGAWMHPARLPLGAGWEGHCTAPGAEGAVPAGAELHLCNLGYATECPRLPKDRVSDAVRFAIVSEQSSGIRLAYVCEKEHLPGEHGRLEYRTATHSWLTPHPDERIQKMAECFVDSWQAKFRRAVEVEEPHDTLHERS
jgi:hypothetical protein